MPRCRPFRKLVNQFRDLCHQPSSIDRAVESALAPITRALVSRCMMEPLEERKMLHTITGTGTFEYVDGSNARVRIAYHNLTAELVFARVNGSNSAVLGEPTVSGTTGGKDLFHIYVAESSVDSFMAIARVPDVTAEVRPMDPFAGGATIRFNDLTGGGTTTGDAGPGPVLLGAKTPTSVQDPGNNLPILNQRFHGLGILGERPNGRLNAGITVAPGQDFGRFFFGGTILGQVTFQGSVDQFYAGALLTGDSRDTDGVDLVNDNFFVGGDIRDLVVGGSVGGIPGGPAEPLFLTHFDMKVRGSVGQIRVGGDWLGSLDAENGLNVPHLRLRQREIETRNIPGINRGSSTDFEGNDTDDGIPALGDYFGMFNNDTFDTAQYLGTFDSRIVGKDGVHVNGLLQATQRITDRTDYYAIPLMAGQVFDVRLVSEVAGLVGSIDTPIIPDVVVGVFDPQGRLIATDYDDTNSLDFRAGRTFRVTADRPGVYRIAVSAYGDTNFNGNTSDEFEPGPEFFPGETAYQIQVKGVGNLSVGGLFAFGNIYDAKDRQIFASVDPDQDIEDLQTPGIMARNGDFGALNSNSVIASTYNFGSVGVIDGNLRSLDANSLGIQEDNTFGLGPSLFVPDGGVGLIRGRGIGDASTAIVTTAFKSGVGPTGPIDNPTDFDDELDFYQAIGGDIQMVDGADELMPQLVTNKAIGTIRAGEITGPFEHIIAVNADRLGSDGIIDLVDVERDFGSPGNGPQITTGPGGNVRYMRAGGQVFRDPFFGGGSPTEIVFDAGESANFVDDSGSQIILEPIPLERRINFQTGEVELINPGTLTVQYYPIRGSGGGVLMEVRSTRGLEVNVSGGSAEIGHIGVSGAGAGVTTRTTDVFGNEIEDPELILDPNSDADLSVVLNGSGVIDVLSIQGGNFNRILNRSNGEIVNVNSNSIGTIAAKTLGIARRTTAAEVLPKAIDYGLLFGGLGIANGIANLFPLIDETTGIFVSGDLVLAQASDTIGNVMVGGIIQTLVANSDKRYTSGLFEGIDGVIIADREMRLINIGEGLASSGTGNTVRGGLYSEGRILQVVNQGLGSDIRGNIVSRGQSIVINDPNTGRADPRQSGGIVSVILNNGSIIDANLMVVGFYEQSREMNFGRNFPDAGGITTEPVFEIGNISLSGQGGIIGANIQASDINNVVVSNGFGIINSTIETPAQGATGSIIADGYGIRDSFFQGGGALNLMEARGKGNRLSTLGFSPTVRHSEKRDFDPYNGRALTEMNDLHKYLGTTATEPVRLKGSRSISGLLDGVVATGGSSAGVIRGQRIYNSVFSYANRISQLVSRESIDTVEVTTGRLDLLQSGGDMDRGDYTIAGPVGVVAVGGTYRGTNEFLATGPDGFINIFATKRSLFGAVRAQRGMNEIRVGTDIGSPSIESSGDINAIRVNGNILDGAFIRTAETLHNLVVSGDIQEGAIIQADAVGNRTIGGTVFGDINIT